MARTKGQLISPIGILTAIGVNVSGIITTTTAIVGSAVTINSTGVNVSGVVTATSFVGDASKLTGITTNYVQSSGISTNLSGGTLKNYSETINVVGNTGTASTINLVNGNFVTATLTGNCTFTFNVGVTTGASLFTLFLTNDATPGRTITWPVSVVWPGGAVPTRTTTANKTDVYSFFTLNNGTAWYGNIAQYNY